MKILHIVASSASGGGPANVLRYLRRSAHENVVIVGRDDDRNFRALAEAATAIHDLPIRRLRLPTLLRTMHIAKAAGADLIHTHGKGAGLYGRVAGLLTGIPVVHTYRGYHNVYRGVWGKAYVALERWLGRVTAQAIAVSSSEGDKILADGLVDPARLNILPNPIEVASEAPAVRLQPGPRHNAICIARISPQKDLITLLKVARRLSDSCVFHVFGGTNSSDRDYERRVMAFKERHAVTNVRFYGDTPNASALIDRFDAFVTTALWEGLPTGVVEAFLAGAPVVGTACTGNVDVIRDGETGLLLPCGDDAAIAEAVAGVLRDTARGRALVERARAFARERFDVDRIVATQESIYARAVGAPASGRRANAGEGR